MERLHQLVNEMSTPYGEPNSDLIRRMEIGEHRRNRLKKWIEDHDISREELIRLTKRKGNYLSDLLGGAKSFGDKIAREIEKGLKMPPFHLDLDERAKIITDPKLIALLNGCEKLPPEGLDHLEKEVDSIIKLIERTRKKANGE